MRRVARQSARSVFTLLRRRAATMVEMAVVLPVFALLVLGTVEFARAFMVHEMMVAAAREGARKAIIPQTTEDEIKTAISRTISPGGIKFADITYTTKVDGETASPTSADRGDEVSIGVSIPYSKVALLTPRFISGSAALSSTCSMRRE